MEETRNNATTSNGSGNEKKKVSTEGFVGILFAVLALLVMFWVGARLFEPYPTFQTPEQAVREAKIASAGTEKKEPVLQATTSSLNEQSKNASSLTSDTAGNEKDPICGMNPYESPTRIEIEYSDGTKIAYVSMACYFQHRDALKKEGITPIKERIIDFATWQSASPKLLDFTSAVWLMEIESIPPGSMPPGVVAFSSEKEAHKFHPDLGGKIASLEEMKIFVEDYLKE